MNATNEATAVRTTIKRNDIGEYVVRLHINGIHNAEADYFTDSYRDALSTSIAMRAEWTEHEPRPPLVLAIEAATTIELRHILHAAKDCATVDAAADLLRANLPGWFIYRGGRHVAIHPDATTARLALITE